MSYRVLLNVAIAIYKFNRNITASGYNRSYFCNKDFDPAYENYELLLIYKYIRTFSYLKFKNKII